MPTLKEIYDDPKTTSRNPTTLAKRAGCTVAGAKRFLNSLSGVQLGKRAVRPPANEFSPTGDVRGVYLADVIFFRDYAGVNQKRTCILTLLEVNSRYAYTRGLTAPTAAKTAEALIEILGDNMHDQERGVAPIEKIRCDGGSEFKGEFSALCEDRGIEIDITEAGTHQRLSRVDRFHGTLRRMIGDLFDKTDSHVWYPHLQDITENYNSRPSLALVAAGKKLSPADIGEREEKKLRAADMARAADVRMHIDTKNFPDGTLVRLLHSRTKEGSKAAWSKKAHDMTFTREAYPILARAGPNSYLVDTPTQDPKIWPHWALQRAVGSSSQPRPGPKIDRQVVSAKRLEARNISEGEQEAALEGPARPKREVKKPQRLDL